MLYMVDFSHLTIKGTESIYSYMEQHDGILTIKVAESIYFKMEQHDGILTLRALYVVGGLKLEHTPPKN